MPPTTITDFLLNYARNEDNLWKLLINEKLIKEIIFCPSCKKPMSINKNIMTFRCQKKYRKGKVIKRCRTEISARKRTFFERSSLTLVKIMQIVVWWCFIKAGRLETIMRETMVSKKTAVDWSLFCREVCIDWAVKRSTPLGGAGVVVEIDEAKFGERKHNGGQTNEGTFVLWGKERNSNKTFFVPVFKPDKDILLEVIKEFILPGTTVVSDCWRAYNCLNEEGYNHFAVNHSIKFIDPQSEEVHFQNIKRQWRNLKEFVPKYGRKQTHFAGYLAEYQFKSVNGHGKELTMFLPAIAAAYPGLPGP